MAPISQDDRVFLIGMGGLLLAGLLGLVLTPFMDWSSISANLSLALSGLSVVLVVAGTGRRFAIPAVVVVLAVLVIASVVVALIMRPSFDGAAYCKTKNAFDLHSADALDDIRTGTVDRSTVLLLRNDLRAGFEVAPPEIEDDIDTLADAYDELSSRLGDNRVTNVLLYGDTLLAPDVRAATARIVEVEDRLCT